MEQLKIARQNAELGHYSIALTAYKTALESKFLTANVSLCFSLLIVSISFSILIFIRFCGFKTSSF